MEDVDQYPDHGVIKQRKMYYLKWWLQGIVVFPVVVVLVDQFPHF